MAFEDYKITSADLNGIGVIGLPDAPELSTEAMQNKFEETARDVIIPRINTVLEKMDEVIPPMVLPEAPLEPQNGDMLVYDSEVGAFVFVQKATSLANLKDVDLTDLANGMYLRYDYPTRSWKATNSSSSVPALDDINDVSITSATNGQCLVYSDGTWVNDNAKLDDLKNVYIHLPQNKQLLSYDSVNDRWTNVDLDGGGHKIEDANGTQLAQRETLQFSGYLKTTDENLNERTVVDDSPETITWANWKTLTDEQKAGKKWLITNIPSADGSITIENMKCVWTNQSPSSAFAAQNIILDTDGDYDFIRVVFSIGSRNISVDVPKGNGGSCSFAGTSGSSSSVNYCREFNYVSDTTLSFLDGSTQYSNANRSTDNSTIKPLYVYTYKASQSIHFSAIAHDVKATQDYSTIEHVVGTWIDGSTLYEKTISCGALPNNTGKIVSHGISNLKKIVEYKGYSYSTTYGNTITMPFSADALYSRVNSNGTDSLQIITGGDLSGYNETYITIRYTKTS